MNALETLLNITESKLCSADLKYCLVNKDKLPLKLDGTPCRPNVDADFVDLEDLVAADLENYAGLGISIKASKVCAIDIDHCFSKEFSVESGDERAKYFLEQFKDAYVEFSFSGTGLRILFKTDDILNYSDVYYIKNSKVHVEYYHPNGSARYVTITGRTLLNNEVKHINISVVKQFLDEYMKKQIFKTSKQIKDEVETRSLQELLIETKKLYLRNSRFQNLWFKQAPGSGRNESELDYQLLVMLYENITTDRELIRQIFETSDYYQSKDFHHKNKWSHDNYRYFNFQYDNIQRRHQ